MKILSLGPAYPLRGGIADFNESLSAALAGKGNELIVFSYKLQYPGFLFPGKTQYSDSPEPSGLDIRSQVNSISLINWMRVVEQINAEDPEILIIHYWMPFFIPALGYICHRIRARKTIKIILLAHNLIPHEPQPGTRFLTRYLIRNIDGLVALSSKVREDALYFRENLPSVVLPHPVYDKYGEKTGRKEALDKLGLSTDSSYLLFFGLIRKYKGLDLLLKAMKYLKDEPIKLIIAGEFYGKKDEYQSIIDEADLNKQIMIRDEFIPDDEVKYYFSASDLVVQPYRSATQSGVTQIACHFEKPAVVTRVGGLPEIVEDGVTGYITDLQPESIAEAIRRYFANPEKEKMKEEIRRKKGEFSWESFVERFLEFAGTLNR